MIMNSWKSIGASECAPPLRMFIIGTGRRFRVGCRRDNERAETFDAAAAACAVASETPSSAFAPRFFLFGVPSSSIIFASSRGLVERVETGEGWRDRLIHTRHCFGDAFAAVSFLISVLSSHASCSPVLAPLGTAARPNAPDSSRTSTSIVGLPRESRISRALIVLMLAFRHRKRALLRARYDARIVAVSPINLYGTTITHSYWQCDSALITLAHVRSVGDTPRSLYWSAPARSSACRKRASLRSNSGRRSPQTKSRSQRRASSLPRSPSRAS